MKQVVLLAFSALACFASCARRPSAEQCDAMLDRYLELSEEEQRPAARAEHIAHRRATLAYVSAEKRCSQEISNAELECAMKAPSANDWEACIEY